MREKHRRRVKRRATEQSLFKLRVWALWCLVMNGLRFIRPRDAYFYFVPSIRKALAILAAWVLLMATVVWALAAENVLQVGTAPCMWGACLLLLATNARLYTLVIGPARNDFRAYASVVMTKVGIKSPERAQRMADDDAEGADAAETSNTPEMIADAIATLSWRHKIAPALFWPGFLLAGLNVLMFWLPYEHYAVRPESYDTFMAYNTTLVSIIGGVAAFLLVTNHWPRNASTMALFAVAVFIWTIIYTLNDVNTINGWLRPGAALEDMAAALGSAFGSAMSGFLGSGSGLAYTAKGGHANAAMGGRAAGLAGAAVAAAAAATAALEEGATALTGDAHVYFDWHYLGYIMQCATLLYGVGYVVELVKNYAWMMYYYPVQSIVISDACNALYSTAAVASISTMMYLNGVFTEASEVVNGDATNISRVYSAVNREHAKARAVQNFEFSAVDGFAFPTNMERGIMARVFRKSRVRTVTKAHEAVKVQIDSV